MELRTLGEILSLLDKCEERPGAGLALDVCLCGYLVRIRTNSLRVLESVAEFCRSFVRCGQPASVLLDIYEMDMAVADSLWRGFDGQPVGDSSLILGPSCICRVHSSLVRAVAVVGTSPDLSCHVSSLLRALAPTLAEASGGLIVHSCGVVDTGSAYLFIGQSGSGKSTVAGLSNPRTILSDEAVVLHELSGKVMCSGTPYSRSNRGTDMTEELRACFFLVKDVTTCLDPLSPAQTIWRLVPNLWGIHRVEQVSSEAFDLCATIAKAVPCYDLHFTRDRGFWRVIDDAISSRQKVG